MTRTSKTNPLGKSSQAPKAKKTRKTNTESMPTLARDRSNPTSNRASALAPKPKKTQTKATDSAKHCAPESPTSKRTTRGKQAVPSPPPPPPPSPITRSSLRQKAPVVGTTKPPVHISSVEAESSKTSSTHVSTVPSQRKSPPESLLVSHMGKGVHNIDAGIDAGVAAAATTLLYQRRFGKEKAIDLSGVPESGSDQSNVSESKVSSEDSDESSPEESDESHDYVPPTNDCSDDDNDILVDTDSEDELRSSFPRDYARKNIVPGGPPKPDVSNLSESEAMVVMKRYNKDRKAYTDKQRTLRCKVSKSVKISSTFSGIRTERLRPMTEVDKGRLLDNHSFMSKEVVQLRIAEEANLRCISIYVKRSDFTNYTVSGFNFYVNATFSEKHGWVVQTAICREGDDILKIPPKDKFELCMVKDRKKAIRTPIKSKFVVPFLLSAVETNPMITYKTMREIMKPYANQYTLTDGILQDARDLAKLSLFGSPADNVFYAKGAAAELRKLGHEVELIFEDRRSTLKKTTALVLAEEVDRRLKSKQRMDKLEQLSFIKKWKEDNFKYIIDHFGVEGGPEFSFLTGIICATSSSKHMVPKLQPLIQADGAHTSFGKYTLLSAYASTANGNMSAIAFGIFFGNEDTSNWSKFWSFVMKVHPSVNNPTMTILTDQDKGSIASVAAIVPLAAQFHCSFHRKQNIIKKCGGGSGTTPLTALWMFNLLVSCNSVAQLYQYKKQHYKDMHPTDVHYLSKLPDECQYPAARCAMGPNICMYSKSASSGSESMNRANHQARDRTAVDIINAIILIVKAEAERFNKFKQKAWDRDDQLLSEKGLELMEEAFEGVDIHEFRVTINREETHDQCTISRKTSKNIFTVTIPIECDYVGSRFGTCTCGVPAKDGVPCKHMVAIVKSSAIPGLTRVQIMPYWWTAAHWRAQYAADMYCSAAISISSIKANTRPDDKLRYCPSFLAGNKKGRPKKNVRQKSLVDLIEESATKKRKRRKKLFCKICYKFNHNTADCYKHPLNQEKTTSQLTEEETKAKSVYEESEVGGAD